MVVVGGYIGTEISCETPGVYVFNTSSLEWVNTFTSLSGGSTDNPFSQQLGQKGDNQNSGLQGSYGYSVPQAVYSVIGGTHTGGATITAPVAAATAGPLATGKPITYTVTGPNGATITETSTASPSTSQRSSTNVGAAVAGAVAGFLFLIALYFAFCALLYRRHLKIYQQHVAMMSVHTGTPTPNPDAEASGLLRAWHRASWLPGHRKTSSEASRYSTGTSTTPGHGPSNSNSNNNIAYAGGGLGSPSHSEEDLFSQLEPSYWGVLLHPRRSLRVINR